MVPSTICLNSPSLLDVENACIRALWFTSVSAALVVSFLIAAIPIRYPWWLTRVVAPFPRFMSVEEAENIIDQSSAAEADPNAKPSPSTPTIDAPKPLSSNPLIFTLSALELVAWLALGVHDLYASVSTGSPAPLHLGTFEPFVIATIWLYSATRILRHHPEPTPPFDLFFLYLVQFAKASVDVGALVYARYAHGTPLPMSLAVAGVVHWVVVWVLLELVMRMPLRVPSKRVLDLRKSGGRIVDEDYTTLWKWISFSWTTDLVTRGTVADLDEKDVPDLSFSFQSKPVYERFMEIPNPIFWRHVFYANSFDIFIDATFTIFSVFCTYASPFFLNLILDEIANNPDPSTRSRAYVYAILMFLATLLKAESDVQHLWFGRRGATRIRSAVMAAVYAKALRRKDFSGIVKKDAKDGATDAKEEDDEGQSTKKAGADTGKIVQLMSSDAISISRLLEFAPMVYSAPIEIVVASVMLYQLLGWSGFAGFSILVIATPINHFVSKYGLKLTRKLMATRDKRMAVLNELIGGIRFIKFFAWERQWTKRAQDVRQTELGLLVKDYCVSVCFSIIWTIVPTFISVLSFWMYVSLGNEMTIAKAFTAIALFNMLRMPLNILPHIILNILQTFVSIKRIENFLKEDDVPDYVSSFTRSVLTSAASPEDQRIGITGASFSWNEVSEETETENKGKPTATATPETPSEVPAAPEQRFELRDINIDFPVGKLTLVVGPTASGKSALLMALLGEMTLIDNATTNISSIIHLPKNPRQLDPTTQLHNCISYCAQTPWLEHATIKQNIIFYEPFEGVRYDAVVRACALQPDLDMLEDGDETEIGARGVSLSGGQKARVALARAVYSRTKHVLLDDPLAAVDSHTARHLYDNVLAGPLMKDRTCILVTHHVDLVRPGAQYLVRMLDGRIDTQGSIRDLEAKGVLENIVHDELIERKQEDTGARTPSDDAETVAEAAIDGKAVEDVQPDHLRGDTETTVVASKKKKDTRKLVEDEAISKGGVKLNIYKTYLAAAGWSVWVGIMLGLTAVQFVQVGEKLWIKTWGNQSSLVAVVTSALFSTFSRSGNPGPTSSGHFASLSYNVTGAGPLLPDLPSAKDHPLFYVGVYAGIGLLASFLSVGSEIIQFLGSYRASKRLFSGLLEAVIGSPMRFFDTTPTGRILNRFSKDIETVDGQLGNSVLESASQIATFIAALLTVVVLLPQFLVPAFFIAYGYYYLSYGYIVAGRSLRRMESTTRSPIFAAFGDTLEGLVTVRAFSKEKVFVDSTHKKIDLTTKMWYGFWMLNRWLLVRFDTLGAVSTLVTTLFSLARLDAGLAGLTITSAMAFTMSVYWTCRMYTQLEMNLNSVERVVEYLDLPQEPPAIVESNRVPAYWPSSATDQLVSVEDLVIRYAPELPPVLHNVSFTLRPKERVGLLGRTGSGKSTLAMALLRFVDPSSGKIVVDGIDISKIGLHDLRSRVTIVPQDAILFSGTIRENLDPFNEHSDADCLDALSRVHINASVSESRQPSRPASIHETASVTTSQTGTTQFDDQKRTVGLASKVSAGGANFSQGQRQLIALARALLRRSTIIIMDEATSSIDFHTDGLVQQTIREEFTNSLLITIAHRIRTIIDYDRLVILDQGKLVEFDTPANLINKEDGVFRNMCLKSGHFEELVEACQAKVSL